MNWAQVAYTQPLYSWFDLFAQDQPAAVTKAWLDEAERIAPDRHGFACVHEDGVTVNLQIELRDGHVVLISFRKKPHHDRPTGVTRLSNGSGECELNDGDWRCFRDWAVFATGDIDALGGDERHRLSRS